MRKTLNQINVKFHSNTAVNIDLFIAGFNINVSLYQKASHNLMAGLEIQNSNKFFLINIIQGNLLKISFAYLVKGVEAEELTLGSSSRLRKLISISHQQVHQIWVMPQRNFELFLGEPQKNGLFTKVTSGKSSHFLIKIQTIQSFAKIIFWYFNIFYWCHSDKDKK